MLKQQMVIELRGVDFLNKGGELMLHAIMARVKYEAPGAVFVMENTNDAPRHKHLQYGICTKSNFKKYNIPFKYIFALIPFYLRRRWNYVNGKEIDVVLDASGFAFGDIWGAKKASKRLGDHVAKWQKAHKKIILLPQAFGPFLNPGLITVMKTIIRYSDLIFARDTLSYQYLEQLDGSNKKFILAPDFTNLLEGTVPSYFNSVACEVAIIVNSKMIENDTDREGKAYFNLLHRMIVIIRHLGFKPYFLMHEGRKDRKIVNIINKRLISKLPVIQEDNPVHVKGIIAKSKAVFTSRFHGLVSCLSQAVPCLATGWSHKYDMLLNDYNYPEGMLEVNCDDKMLLAKIESVLMASSKYLIIEKLKYAALKQKQRSEEMWQKVFKEMGADGKENNYSLNPVAAIPSGFF